MNQDVEITGQLLWQVFRRQRWIILGIAGVIAGLGALYCVIATPIYKATAQLLIDLQQARALDSGITGLQVMDDGMVESQVAILQSERIAEAVLKKLGEVQAIKDERDGVKKGEEVSGNGLLGAIFPFLFGSSPESEYEQFRKQIISFGKALEISRELKSYVITISFESPDAELAAKTANTVAEAYIVDQLESKYQATRRASGWLQERIGELRDQAVAADRAVEEFKIKNNIVDTSRGSVGEQQLGELNTQLVASRAQVAESQARYDRVQQIIQNGMASGFSDEVVSDVLNNDVFNRLRTQLLEAQKREAEWSKRYGHDHIAVANLRSEIEGLKRALFNELNRVAETYKSDLDIAKARQVSLEKSFEGLVGQAQKTSKSQVDLRELESTAQTYRALYENFLQRFMQAMQQQSFPITEARVITDASQPIRPSRPKTLLIVAGSLMLGLLVGGAVGYGREVFNQSFRVPTDIEQNLGVDCLGILPKLAESEAVQQVGPGGAFESATGPLRQVIADPLSRFAETLRSIKVSADISIIGRAVKVIGLTSTLPKEGKTTVSANFAQLIAHSGNRCILVDADLRNPTLSRRLAPDRKIGLLELLSGAATFEDVVVTDKLTGLKFIPAVVPRNVVHTGEILASEPMEKVLAMLKQKAEYIIFDLPPLAPVVDAAASAHLVDGYVYVIEWAETPRNLVVNTLKTYRNMHEKILGCILNKADVAALRRLENYGSKYHYHKYYAGYGREGS